MHVSARAALVVGLAALAAVPAHGSGAWRTYVRPTGFTAAVADSDTLWLASRDAGLLRYSMTTHAFASWTREPDGLVSNQLNDVALDARGRLWVATAGRGASVLAVNRASWSLVNTFDGLPSDTVNAFTVQGDTVWIATSRGLALWTGGSVSGSLPDGVNPSPFANDDIRGVVPAGDTLWVATRAGVYVARLSQALAAWTAVNTGLGSLATTQLVWGDTAPLVLAAGTVYRYDAATARWVAAGGIGVVNSLRRTRAGVVAASDQGLYAWNGATWTTITTTLRSSAASPFALAFAAGRMVAAGRPVSAPDQRGVGVYVQPGGGGAGAWAFDFPPGPPGNGILNLDVEGPRTYVSTGGNGIGRLNADGSWTTWFPPSGPAVLSDTLPYSPKFVFGMLIDRESNKWFGNWAPSNGCDPIASGSLDRMRDPAGVVTVTHLLLPAPDSALFSHARSTTLDSSGTHGRWFGMDGPCPDENESRGLLYVATPGAAPVNWNTTNTTGLPSDRIPALVAVPDRVWVGTDNGLVHFTPGAAAPVFHAATDRLDESIRALAVRPGSDTLWVLTSSKLYLFSISGVTEGHHYPYLDVSAAPSVSATRPMDVGRDGTVYYGSTRGVRVRRPGAAQYEDWTSTNSPLADDDVRAIRVDRVTGAVWIGTAGGVNRYDPGFVGVAAELPSLAVTVWPNPARLTAIGVPIRLAGNGASYTGTIYDLNGRRVAAVEARGNGLAVWDGRDARGDVVGAGVYFLRAESGGRSAVVRLVLLR